MRTRAPAMFAAWVVLSLPATGATAPLRSPQVPVSGTALAGFFASKGQSISVVGDQRDVPSVSLEPGTTTITEVASFGNGTFGLYNASFATPPLYQVFPGAASSGWISVVSLRTAPTRLVVNLFDPSGAFQGSSTYLAGPPDPAALGLYASGANTVYSQDTRNAGGFARILVYDGTGSHAGSTWFACELSNDPTGDFADLVMLLTFSTPPVGTKRSTWGRLQQLYR